MLVDITKKKILIVFPSPLFPVEGMSQVRTIEQITRLSKDFILDLAFIGRDNKELQLHKEKLLGICENVVLLNHPKFEKGTLTRIFRTLYFKLIYKRKGKPIEYQVSTHPAVLKKILRLCNENAFDLILVHYWHLGIIFSKLSKSILKAIDTHYVVQENLEVFNKGLYENVNNNLLKRELGFSLERQNEYFYEADILIFNSEKQAEIIKKIFPEKHLIVTPNGQPLDKFLNYSQTEPEQSLLFYGSLSNQFNKKALKLLIHQIIPSLRKVYPALKVIFLGARPPEWLQRMHNGRDFTVTGFVEDIRPFIAGSYLSVLPLSTASGFRGRAIELMALGVPVIGTHNALDSIGITTGVDGYITDDVNEMIKLALDLFQDRELRHHISLNAKKLVSEKYSIEATFGKLSGTIQNILNNPDHG